MTIQTSVVLEIKIITDDVDLKEIRKGFYVAFKKVLNDHVSDTTDTFISVYIECGVCNNSFEILNIPWGSEVYNKALLTCDSPMTPKEFCKKKVLSLGSLVITKMEAHFKSHTLPV